MKYLSCLLLCMGLLFAQSPLDPQKQVPLDPAVILKTLPNGFTYYIRKNAKPEKRAFLWLAIRAGSVLEDEDQQGLAHFLEHMAFNGTKNFEKQALVSYLEKIGMRFGADLNAYTSFDETVYMLEVPTDQAEFLDNGFQILEDWAHQISLDPSEVEKERGVVKEEWRLSRGANARILDKQLPLIFHGSRYANRLPIGKMEVIDNADRERVKRFYEKWYRPELMALIAVGDFDTTDIEARIQKQFSSLPKAEVPLKREYDPVPEHDQTLVSIEKDPELRFSSIQLLYKRPARGKTQIADYRRGLLTSLFQNMLNNRLAEKTREANPPYLQAFMALDSLSHDKDMVFQFAAVKEGAFEEGIRALALEARRVNEQGFGLAELERAKSDLLRAAEVAFSERDKTESQKLLQGLLANFLEQQPKPDAGFVLEASKQMLPGISLEEVNAVGKNWTTPKSRVVLLSGPDKAGLSMPSAQEVLGWLDDVAKVEIAAYQDEDLSKKPLLANMPTPGKVVESKQHEAVGLTEWKLSNGARVFLKPTDFKNDEILIQAISAGGSSLVSDADYVPANHAADILEESGLGDFTATQLQKKLAGKSLDISTRIGGLWESVRGSATPKDLEDWFQLCNLYFSAPRFDETAFAAYKIKLQNLVKNRLLAPENVFRDAIVHKLYPGDLRREPLSEATLEKLDLAKSKQIYGERFANVGDFAFFIVGNFKLDEIQPLVERYIGGLPGKGSPESWKNVDQMPARGELKLEVYKGLEPKCSIQLFFSGKDAWTPEKQVVAGILGDALDIRLREVLREDKSGTYGVGTFVALRNEPDMRYTAAVFFGCGPEKLDALVSALQEELAEIRKNGIGEEVFQKVRESNLRDLETQQKKNGFWLSSLTALFTQGRDFSEINRDRARIEAVTLADLKAAASRYLDPANSCLSVLKPEAKTEKAAEAGK